MPFSMLISTHYLYPISFNKEASKRTLLSERRQQMTVVNRALEKGLSLVEAAQIAHLTNEQLKEVEYAFDLSRFSRTKSNEDYWLGVDFHAARYDTKRCTVNSRNLEIFKLFESGTKTKAISIAYSISVSRVQQILNSTKRKLDNNFRKDSASNFSAILAMSLSIANS